MIEPIIVGYLVFGFLTLMIIGDVDHDSTEKNVAVFLLWPVALGAAVAKGLMEVFEIK